MRHDVDGVLVLPAHSGQQLLMDLNITDNRYFKVQDTRLYRSDQIRCDIYNKSFGSLTNMFLHFTHVTKFAKKKLCNMKEVR